MCSARSECDSARADPHGSRLRTGWLLDAISKAVKARVPVGHGSGGVLVEPSGARAFVACGPDNSVAVVDLQTLKVTGHVDAGGEPDGMAWAVRQ